MNGFPSDFWWGTAASATQTEGAPAASDWRAWELMGRAPVSGDGNGFATKYRSDFELLAGWGLPHHRLSLDWARLEPVKGLYDQGAIEHYREVLTAAREAGLLVWVCLLHSVLPTWFADAGGFLAADAGRHWARHVDFVADTFGDLVFGWKPVNGPSSFAIRRYLSDKYPPGHVSRQEFRRRTTRDPPRRRPRRAAAEGQRAACGRHPGPGAHHRGRRQPWRRGGGQGPGRGTVGLLARAGPQRHLLGRLRLHRVLLLLRGRGRRRRQVAPDTG